MIAFVVPSDVHYKALIGSNLYGILLQAIESIQEFYRGMHSRGYFQSGQS